MNLICERLNLIYKWMNSIYKRISLVYQVGEFEYPWFWKPVLLSYLDYFISNFFECKITLLDTIKATQKSCRGKYGGLPGKILDTLRCLRPTNFSQRGTSSSGSRLDPQWMKLVHVCLSSAKVMNAPWRNKWFQVQKIRADRKFLICALASGST